MVADTAKPADPKRLWGRRLLGLAPYLAVILCVLAADQASKAWVLHGLDLPHSPGRRIELAPLISLTYVENRGVSFGLFKAGSTLQVYLLAALTVAITGLFSAWLARGARFWQSLGLSLAIGGAIGNMIDRLTYHYVVDFIDLSQLYFPWVFNVADSCISLGAGLLLLDLLFGRPEASAGKDEKASTKAISPLRD